MRTYQTLSLIGCIIGIFLMLFLFGIAGLGTIANDISLNITKQYGNGSELATQQQKHAANEAVFKPFGEGVFLSFLIYIALIPITFIIKSKTKVVGIIVIILGFITMAITNVWGLIPFALLLPAGILAIRYKPGDKALAE